MRFSNPRGLALMTICALGVGCGGDDGGLAPIADPTPTTTEIVFSKHRDNVSGAIQPILSESGGGFDAVEVDSPAVLFDPLRPGGDRYLLYYEATAANGISSIGVASSSSTDFESLTAPRQLAVGLGGGGSGFEAGSTDPTVVVDPAIAPGNLGRYRMWFEGRSGAGGINSTILSARSADGLEWTDFEACTGLEASFGSQRVADPSVLLDDGMYRMWFEASNGVPGGIEGAGRIGYAESSDGISWILRDATGNEGPLAEPVLLPRGSGFDGHSVNAPTVVLESRPGADRRFLMCYEAGDFANNTENSIGFAESPDGRTWQRLELPVLAPSSDTLAPLPFDSGDLEHPQLLIDPELTPADEGYFLIWYTGDGEANSSPNRIGFAEGWVPAPAAPGA